MRTVQQQQQQTKNTPASRLQNPFKWRVARGNNNKTSGAQLQGNEMSVDNYNEQEKDQNNNDNGKKSRSRCSLS